VGRVISNAKRQVTRARSGLTYLDMTISGLHQA
jgi:hypothetical protein